MSKPVNNARPSFGSASSHLSGTSSLSGMSKYKMMQVIQIQAAELVEVKGRLDEKQIEETLDWIGLLNKEHFPKAAQDLFQNPCEQNTRKNLTERRSTELSSEAGNAMLLFDGANFKGVNDNLGHLAGDQLIIYIGKTLSEHFRGKVGHIGGDEFAVAERNITLEIIERRVKAINGNMHLTLKDGTLLTPVVDFGVYFMMPGDSIEHGLAKADEDLYVRKQARKDREDPTTSWIIPEKSQDQSSVLKPAGLG